MKKILSILLSLCLCAGIFPSRLYAETQWEIQGPCKIRKPMEEMTAEELLDIYVKQLKNLVEHSEIWEPLHLPYHMTVFAGGKEQMKECYEDAKTLTKLQTKGYYISGKRDEIISYLQKISVESVNVYDVKLSIWDS